VEPGRKIAGMENLNRQQLMRSPETRAAVAAAFAWVAAADARTDVTEVARFRTLVTGWCEQEDIRQASYEDFDQLCAMFNRNFDQALAETHRRLAMIRTRDSKALVLSAAQQAIVADARLEEQEESVMRELRRQLEIDEEAASESEP
jgi:hypothetical protein